MEFWKGLKSCESALFIIGFDFQLFVILEPRFFVGVRCGKGTGCLSDSAIVLIELVGGKYIIVQR